MLFINFLQNNLGTLLVLSAVVLITALLVLKLVKDKKAGKSGCSCGCSSCALNGMCHQGGNKKQ